MLQLIVLFYINFREFNICLKILPEQFNEFLRLTKWKTNNHKIVGNITKSVETSRSKLVPFVLRSTFRDLNRSHIISVYLYCVHGLFLFQYSLILRIT